MFLSFVMAKASSTASLECFEKSTETTIFHEPILGAADFDYWIHSPLHPDNKQPVTFKTKVTDTEGIVKVELMVYEYELYEKNGIPSAQLSF